MPIEREILSMFELAKIAKDKCTHRSTNTFNASISTHGKPSSVCGYTPLANEFTREKYNI